MWTWRRSNMRRNRTTHQLQIAVLGTPVRDAYLEADAIEFANQSLNLRTGQAQLTVAYQGEPIRFGEKRYAQSNLSSLNLTGSAIRNGGGVYHTSAQLARLCAQRHLPAAISTIDSIVAWPELETAYGQLGINHISLALEQSTTNLILTNGQPDRLILKSPDTPLPLSTKQINHLLQRLPERLDLLVVNSPKSVDLARGVLQAARKAQAQYSVLTPSLSLHDRIELLLKHDQASVCNLSEFALIAKTLGIECPSHEESAPLDEVAQAMALVAHHCKTGDLVVTLGARGCLAGDRATGSLVHIGLQPHHWQRVQDEVRMHPDRKNGIGDRFFGSFVLAHRLAASGCGNRTAHATRHASLEMIHQLAPELAPELNWFAAYSFPQRFAARNINRGRRHEWLNRTLHPGWGSYTLQYS